MIILKLRGALGNQMFQYAFARALAIQKKQLLFIDKDSLESYANAYGVNKESRMYKLHYFDIKGILLPFKLSRLVSILKYLGKVFIKIEKIDNYDPVYDANLVAQAVNSKDIILDGHWLSEKYFNKYKNEIFRCFDLTKYAKKVDKNLFKEINNCNSVFLHIRRTDYVSNPEVAQQQGIVNLNYYESAIQLISKKIKNIRLFVFSDDIEWAKNNFKPNCSVKYINGNINNPIQDMFLMSNCKHSIIANSTFSWWAAYLNKNENKIVISPKHWFLKDKPSSEDILPPDWIKL